MALVHVKSFLKNCQGLYQNIVLLVCLYIVRSDVAKIGKTNDLCGELYKALEEEYEYLNSDEVVDETIRVNEYDFDECGCRFKY